MFKNLGLLRSIFPVLPDSRLRSHRHPLSRHSQLLRPLRNLSVSILAIGSLASCGLNDPAADRSQTPSDPTSIAAQNAAQSTDTIDRPQVVTTVNILCALITQLTQAPIADRDPESPASAEIGSTGTGSTGIDLTCLLDRGQDPHTYQPTPSDRRMLADADLILYGGYGLEAGLIQLITASDTPAVAVYEQAVPQPIQGSDAHNHSHGNPDPETHDPGHDPEHDPEHDHESSQTRGADRMPDQDQSQDLGSGSSLLVPDPHVWHDAALGRDIVAILAQELTTLAPTAADSIQSQASTLKTELEQLDRWIQVQIDTIPPNQRTLITTHDAFRYFGQAYGLQTWGILSGLNPDQQPTATTLATLADRIQADAVPLLFPEQGLGSGLLETVAQTAGVRVSSIALGVDMLGTSGDDRSTYQQLLVTNTCAIVTGLGGTCAPWP